MHGVMGLAAAIRAGIKNSKVVDKLSAEGFRMDVFISASGRIPSVRQWTAIRQTAV